MAVKKNNLKNGSPSMSAGVGFKSLFTKGKVGGANGTPSTDIVQEQSPSSTKLVELKASSPVNDVATSQQPVVPTINSAVVLSAEQLERIAENKRKAFERQKLKQAQGGDAGQKEAAKEVPVQSPKKLLLVSTKESSDARTPDKSVAKLPLVTPDKFATPKSPTSRVSNAIRGCGSSFDEMTCASWSQYHGLYKQRLGALRDSALTEATRLWSGEVRPDGFLREIKMYRQGLQQQVVLVGVLFKKMKNRPDVIKTYKEDVFCVGALPEEGISTTRQLCSADDDEMWLEDGTARVKLLTSKEYLGALCSGLVVAARGVTNADGEFQTAAMCFAHVPAVPILPEIASPPKFVAFMSGLAIDDGSSTDSFDGVLDFLRQGILGHGASSMSIEQLVICGGLFACDGGAKRPSKAALAAADNLLAQLAAILPVDIMPGQYDPTNLSLPQAPFHPYLFPRARGHGNLRFASNPYERDLGAVHVLGHSGQPVKDVLRCTKNVDALGALGMCLETLHLAPTAPETLAMPPFIDVDPFVISTMPHILFSGAHDQVQHEWKACAKGVSGTQCVCVPAFHKVPAIVLVNLNNTRDIRVESVIATRQ